MTILLVAVSLVFPGRWASLDLDLEGQFERVLLVPSSQVNQILLLLVDSLEYDLDLCFTITD